MHKEIKVEFDTASPCIMVAQTMGVKQGSNPSTEMRTAGVVCLAGSDGPAEMHGIGVRIASLVSNGSNGN